MSRTADFIKEVYAGKTIGRILFNWQVAEKLGKLTGKVVDLGGGGSASYYHFLPKNLNITRTNRAAGSDIDAAVDLNKPLPYASGSFDSALLFNVIYILEDPARSLAEIKRILRPGGTLYLASPFTANEMPEPHDYSRFTAEGLERLLKQAGFNDMKLARYGERATAAVGLLHPFFVFNTVRLLAFILALATDKLVPAKIRSEHPCPIGYFATAQK
jgi:SAM-dependent methyltransferase